jgi:hypothetical protein
MGRTAPEKMVAYDDLLNAGSPYKLYKHKDTRVNALTAKTIELNVGPNGSVTGSSLRPARLCG